MRRHTVNANHASQLAERFIWKMSTGATRLFDRYLPDPYVIAVMLTVLTWTLAAWLAPRNGVETIIGSWYKGAYDIAGFAFLVASMLVTGYALSVSKPVAACLRWFASIPKSEFSAVIVTFMVTAVVSLLHWAVGLIVAGLLAKEVAKKVRCDFAWLVAAAYSGFGLFSSGLSCSVQLISAMHGSPLNFVEKVTGQSLPLRTTVFSTFNLAALAGLAVLLPAVFYLIRPRNRDDNIGGSVNEPSQGDDIQSEPPREGWAGRIERSVWINLILAGAFAAQFAIELANKTFAFDFTTMIAIFFSLGLILHGSPRAYIRAFGEAARHAGGVLLQFPLYGGIMGVMLTTGLAGEIAKAFTAVASPLTLPFWSFVSSLIISIFLPSAGGHWAVQGAFIVPVAHALHASQAATVMGVAFGEGTADMIQPMWALPLLAITGISLPRLMRYTLVAFIVMVVVFSLSLLLVAPQP